MKKFILTSRKPSSLTRRMKGRIIKLPRQLYLDHRRYIHRSKPRAFSPRKFIVLLIKKTDLASALAVRLTKYTGKSKVPIHPKHFVNQKPWFTKGINKKDIVVDLGAGNGQNSIKIARLCKKVISLEIDPDLIRIGEASVKHAKLKNIYYREANLEKKLDLKTNSCDKVIFLDVLEHLKKRDSILREINRILKPSGVLYLGVPNSQTSWKKFQRSAGVNSFSDPDHKIEFSQGSITSLLAKNGFKIKNFGYGKWDIPFRGVLDVAGAFSLSLYKYADKKRALYTKKHPIEASGFEIIATK